uniref:WGS project CAEQ00000000 data, annotated contig 786 n=1 Tax=Trypanosoma congolense (strain IL3000) TaxID=1068625 RepID=F9WIH1_TRYCI|nr:unnamed protein product [Trypanosoma congolense IL3000]
MHLARLHKQPHHITREMESGLRRVKVIACGIEIDVPAEAETTVRALMRAIVALAFPNRTDRSSYCCLFLGDRALPEGTRVAELPTDAILHLHFVADGIAKQGGCSDGGVTPSPATSAPPVRSDPLRRSASPVVVRPLDTLESKPRGNSYDRVHLLRRARGGGPGIISPLIQPMCGHPEQRGDKLTAARGGFGTGTTLSSAASYPSLRREYKSIRTLGGSSPPSDNCVGITVMLTKPCQGKTDANVDPGGLTSPSIPSDTHKVATEDDKSVTYRHLRVNLDYPVGTLREFFDIATTHSIYLGEMPIMDDRTAFRALSAVGTQIFSFRPCSSARARLGLPTRGINVAQNDVNRAKQKDGGGSSIAGSIIGGPGSVPLGGPDGENAKENKGMKAETERVGSPVSVQYMKLNPVPVTEAGDTNDICGASGLGRQNQREKNTSVEEKQSGGGNRGAESAASGSSGSRSNPRGTTATPDGLRTKPLGRVPGGSSFGQTHPCPAAGGGVVGHDGRWPGTDPLGNHLWHSSQVKIRRTLDGKHVAGKGRAAWSRTPLPLDPVAISESREEKSVSPRSNTRTLVVVPPVQQEQRKTSGNGRNAFDVTSAPTFSPSGNVRRPVSILASGLMQKHRGVENSASPTTVQNQANNANHCSISSTEPEQDKENN